MNNEFQNEQGKEGGKRRREEMRENRWDDKAL